MLLVVSTSPIQPSSFWYVCSVFISHSALPTSYSTACPTALSQHSCPLLRTLLKNIEEGSPAQLAGLQSFPLHQDMVTNQNDVEAAALVANWLRPVLHSVDLHVSWYHSTSAHVEHLQICAGTRSCCTGPGCLHPHLDGRI